MNGWLALIIVAGAAIGMKVLRKKGILPEQDQVQVTPAQATAEAQVQEATAEAQEEVELPNWKGKYDKVGIAVAGHGRCSIDIAYPSLTPFETAFIDQTDGVAAFVSTLGYDDTPEGVKPVSVNHVEEAFVASRRRILAAMENYRRSEKRKFSDFAFVVEKQEVTMVNNMPACKYIGKHTYTLDGAVQEIPFAAYSFYTGQIENYSYFTAVVVDDNIKHPYIKSLPEGTIEAYAKKMVESVKLKESEKV